MQDRITEGLVRKLTADPPAKDTTVFDVVLQRFAFRVKPPAREGGKPSAWFFVRYTAPNGVERRTKVGDPDTMTVEDARKRARAELAKVDSGRDPRKEKQQMRAAPTMRELAEKYLASDTFTGKAAKVQANDKARITAHIIPRVGAEKADDITPSMARRLGRQIAEDTRTNKRKRRLGGPGAARKTLRLLAAMLRWAKHEELIAALPFTLRDLALEGDGARDTVITSAEDYARLFTTMAAMVADGKLRPDVRAFFVLVASTGLRRGEAQGLHWGQVNLERRQITLTDTKGAKLARARGRSQLKTEIVGIPPIAAVTLAEIMPSKPSPDALVFPPVQRKPGKRSKTPDKPSKVPERLSVNRDWVAVRTAAGLPADLTLHGLRHSVGTVGAIGGMSMPQLQALLRHKQPGTTARYIHMAQTAGGLADMAMGAVLPAADAPSADVVPLRRGTA